MPMADPVLLGDGTLLERASIADWVRSHPEVGPKALCLGPLREALKHFLLVSREATWQEQAKRAEEEVLEDVSLAQKEQALQRLCNIIWAKHAEIGELAESVNEFKKRMAKVQQHVLDVRNAKMEATKLDLKGGRAIWDESTVSGGSTAGSTLSTDAGSRSPQTRLRGIDDFCFFSEEDGGEWQPDVVEPAQALASAASEGDLNTVRALIEKGASLEEPERLWAVPLEKWEEGCTPLMHACSKGHFQVASYLLNSGANFQAHSAQEQLTAIHWAAVAGSTRLLQCLFHSDGGKTAYKMYVNDVKLPCGTPLHAAALCGHLSACRFLCLQAGANVEALHPSSGVTPLIVAVANNFLPVVKFLIEVAHADVHQASRSGVTPLDVAVSKRNKILVDYLKKHTIE